MAIRNVDTALEQDKADMLLAVEIVGGVYGEPLNEGRWLIAVFMSD